MKRERVYSKMSRARVLVSVGAGGRWVRGGVGVGGLLCAGCRVVAEQAAKVTPASQLSGRYSSSLLLFVLEGIAVPPATSPSSSSSQPLPVWRRALSPNEKLADPLLPFPWHPSSSQHRSCAQTRRPRVVLSAEGPAAGTAVGSGDLSLLVVVVV